MSENENAAPQPHHPEVQYERKDAKARWIFGLLGAGLIFAIAIHVGIWWFFRDYEAYQGQIKKSSFPLASQPSRDLPPEPRLEQLRSLEGRPRSGPERINAQESRLQRYGKTSEEGFVHIPLERALELIPAQLPVRPAVSGAQLRRAEGLLDGGEPNSGRLFQRRNP